MHKVLEEFKDLINTYCGLYFDSLEGYKEFKSALVTRQNSTIKEFRKTNPDLANINYLDTTYFFYGSGDPNKSNHLTFHKSTQGEVKQRNSKEGLNSRYIANMIIVTIYQYWEEYYREKIAKLFNIDKNDLRSPIWGDLRIFRHSIIHHRGIALKEVKKCEIYKWFEEGDTLFFNSDKMQIIFKHLYGFLNTIIDHHQNMNKDIVQ